MFKKITFIISFVLIVTNQLSAQISFKDTVLYKADFTTESDIYANTWIYNLSNSTDTISWNRVTNELGDAAWESAVCDIIQCHGTDVNSNTFEMGSGDSGYLSFHFYPKSKRGSGKMVVNFFRASRPFEGINVTMTIDVWGAVNVKAVKTTVTDLYPNPSNHTIQIKNELIAKGQLMLFNAQGQLVDQKDYVSGETIDISKYPSGVYNITIKDENQLANYRLIKN